jgi:hypothetical protein
MLRFAEELLLLLLADQGGKFIHLPDRCQDYALATSVLMDLTLEGRIDTDLDRLILVDSTPTGDDLLDPVLADIAASRDHNVQYWLERATDHAREIRRKALNRLVYRKIVDRRGDNYHWVFRFDWANHKWHQSRRYPVIDGEARQEVKVRIMAELFEGEIPNPRDVMIISLADACGIFPALLTPTELERVAPRIAMLRSLEMLSRGVFKLISEVRAREKEDRRPAAAERTLEPAQAAT